MVAKIFAIRIVRRAPVLFRVHDQSPLPIENGKSLQLWILVRLVLKPRSEPVTAAWLREITVIEPFHDAVQQRIRRAEGQLRMPHQRFQEIFRIALARNEFLGTLLQDACCFYANDDGADDHDESERRGCDGRSPAAQASPGKRPPDAPGRSHVAAVFFSGAPAFALLMLCLCNQGTHARVWG